MTATDGGRHVGPTQIAAAHRALDERMERAERLGEHVWMVAVAYAISEDTARALATGQPITPLLDAENMMSLAPGCFRCEEELTPQLLYRRCRGDRGVHP